VKAEPEPQKKDTYEPERILIPGVIEGYSSFKSAVSKLTEEKDLNSKQEGAVRVVFEVDKVKCFVGCGIRRFNFRLLADLLSHRV
jgi:hypothetical protein